jgi:hypothetical protein
MLDIFQHRAHLLQTNYVYGCIQANLLSWQSQKNAGYVILAARIIREAVSKCIKANVSRVSERLCSTQLCVMVMETHLCQRPNAF